MKNGLAAVKFLTLGQRFKVVDIDLEQVGNGAAYFPLVGLGSVLVLTDRFVELYLGSEILSVILVAVLALMPGPVHFKGLQRTFNAILANSGLDKTSERRTVFLGCLQ